MEIKIHDIDNIQQAARQFIEGIKNILEPTSNIPKDASIESARAGEAGRGFAVVANQIRDLAEETSIDKKISILAKLCNKSTSIYG